MATQYVLGSLDQNLYLIVHCAHPGAKTTCWYECTEDDAFATRFDYYTVASMMLITLGTLHPAIDALNLMPLPLKDGAVNYQPNLGL